MFEVINWSNLNKVISKLNFAKNKWLNLAPTNRKLINWMSNAKALHMWPDEVKRGKKQRETFQNRTKEVSIMENNNVAWHGMNVTPLRFPRIYFYHESLVVLQCCQLQG